MYRLSRIGVTIAPVRAQRRDGGSWLPEAPRKEESLLVTAMVPVKTTEGQAELSARKRRVSQRHRTVLLLVDGRRDEMQVRSLAARAGVPESCFDELMEQGLIVRQRPMVAGSSAGTRGAAAPQQVDLHLGPPDEAVDSLLPPSRSLQPESVLGDLSSPSSWFHSEQHNEGGTDEALEEAREILIRAVRAEAPVAGSLTLLRLRRARSRSELAALLDEVETRITKPHRSLAALQTLRHVRHLLAQRTDSPTSTR